jgi:competence protein ComGC
METIMIIVLLIIAIIFLIILIDVTNKNKALNIKNKSYASALDKSNNQNKYLRSKNENLKIAIDEQEARFNKHLKKTFDYGESKTNELLTKYQSALKKIVERDEKIRDKDIKIESLISDEKHINKAYIGLDNEVNHLQNCIDEKEAIIKLRDSQIIELEKTKKKYSQRVYELHGEKDFAIHQSKSSIKLCNEMSKMFKLMNSELESIETQLLEKIKL